MAAAVGYRVSISHYGRNLRFFSLQGGQESSLLQPHRIRDKLEEGRLSVRTGREILDLFRSQVPVNAFIHSQIAESNLDPERVYLITGDRELYKKILLSLRNQVSVYRNAEGMTFDGNHPPDIFVLESSLPRSKLLTMPVLEFSYPETPDKRPYLWLSSQRAVELFFSGSPPPIPVNLILSEPADVPPEFQGVVESVYVIGRNARFLGPGERISGTDLILTHGNITVNYARGRIQPPGRMMYVGGLFLLGMGAVVLGSHEDPVPVIWFIWSCIFVGAALMYSPRQPLLVGLMLAALIRLGWLQPHRRVVWYLLAGLMVYGFAFAPYRLDPFYGNTDLWAGTLIGSLTMMPVLGDWLVRPTQNREVVAGVIAAAVLALTITSPFGDGGWIPSLEEWILILFPYIVLYHRQLERTRGFLWITGLFGWCLLLLRPEWSFVWLSFAVGMFAWLLEVEVFSPWLLSSDSPEDPEPFGRA